MKKHVGLALDDLARSLKESLKESTDANRNVAHSLLGFVEHLALSTDEEVKKIHERLDALEKAGVRRRKS